MSQQLPEKFLWKPSYECDMLVVALDKGYGGEMESESVITAQLSVFAGGADSSSEALDIDPAFTAPCGNCSALTPTPVRSASAPSTKASPLLRGFS